MRKLYDHILFEEFINSKSKYADILYKLYNNSFNNVNNDYRKKRYFISLDTYINDDMYKDYRKLKTFPIYLLTDCYIKLLSLLITIFLIVYFMFYTIKNILIPFIIDFNFIDIWSDLLYKGTIFLSLMLSIYTLMYVLNRFIYYIKHRDILKMFKYIENKGLDGEVIKKYFNKDFKNDTSKISITKNYYKIKFNDGTFKLLNTVDLFEIISINYLKLQQYNLNDLLYIKDKDDGTYTFEFQKIYSKLILQIKHVLNTEEVNLLVNDYMEFMKKGEYIKAYELIETEEFDQVHLYGQEFTNDLIDLLLQNTPNYENINMINNLENNITNYLKLIMEQYKITGYNEQELNEVNEKLNELNKDVYNLEKIIPTNNLYTKKRFQKLKEDIKVVQTLVSLPIKDF